MRLVRSPGLTPERGDMRLDQENRHDQSGVDRPVTRRLTCSVDHVNSVYPEPTLFPTRRSNRSARMDPSQWTALRCIVRYKGAVGIGVQVSASLDSHMQPWARRSRDLSIGVVRLTSEGFIAIFSMQATSDSIVAVWR